ncbi:hypothetical protein AWJ20_1394 [Sugiyamaella lignohabitans]|uniref:Serine aminopeptidase S33 domain-containing protein n=1 Tax=Sugiyamaella lignohabitans TaxID=796027 RepID=A0A167DNR5_9ASCO|nr:uncharacterized protein AWJ20_1394 [Sugiyamaella lignohabitans]ANB13113.1 hypothetical protein AWJ20_1394 [Sugiyamaella lignohabitans]
MRIKGKELNVWACGKTSGKLAGKLGQPIQPKELTIFFIHGLGSSQNYYYALLPELVKRANCILMDTEGSALSSLGPLKPSVNSIVGDIKDLLLSYGVTGKLIIVGHSMGGITATKFAEKYHSVSGLILISPVHPNETIQKVMANRAKTVRESNSVIEIANSVAENAPGSLSTYLHRAFIRSLVSQQSPSGYAAMCEVIATAEPADYSKINIPVLILVGEDDKTAPYETCSKVIEHSLSGPTNVHKLRGVGHWPCIECSDDVTRNIVNWLLAKGFA